MTGAHDSDSLRVTADFAWLATGVEPPSWRVMRDGRDITDQPEIWAADERARREQSLAWAGVVAVDMERRFDVVRNALTDPDPAAEKQFERAPLPREYAIGRRVGGDDLAQDILTQVLEVPRRWQLDLLGMSIGYISDSGPNWRRWKRIARRLDKSDPTD